VIHLPAIIYAVTEHTGLDLAEVRERHGRHPRVTRYRELVAICAKHLTTASFPDIAEAITGQRDRHSTYSAAYRRGRDNPTTLAEVDKIILTLKRDTA